VKKVSHTPPRRAREKAERQDQQMTRTKLFISYSHRDSGWLKRVREQLDVLESEGLIDGFDDTRIDAGADWYKTLDHEMLEAKIALLLISPTFLTSSFIRNDEVPRLIERHKLDGMQLYPLLVRDCPWQNVRWLSPLQMRPPGPRALAAMKGGTLDKCLADVAREIASIVGTGSIPQAGTPQPEKAVATILSDCYRRALFTRMHAQHSWEAMFASIKKCRETIHTQIPNIRNKRLQSEALEILSAVEQIEQQKANPDPDLINKLKIAALHSFRKLAEATGGSYPLPQVGKLAETTYFSEAEADAPLDVNDLKNQLTIDPATDKMKPQQP
jgi:hypothetical protein